MNEKVVDRARSGQAIRRGWTISRSDPQRCICVHASALLLTLTLTIIDRTTVLVRWYHP